MATKQNDRWSSDDHNCQIWSTTLQWLWRKCNSTIFPLEVYGSFLLPWQPNQEADHRNFSYFGLPLPKQHLYQIKNHTAVAVFKELSFIKFLFQNWMLPWQPNKMTTGQRTLKLGRQSSNDHNCQVWFVSLQWLWRKCNLTIFPL